MDGTKLPVNLKELADALTALDFKSEKRRYLDRETGKVVVLPDSSMPDEKPVGDAEGARDGAAAPAKAGEERGERFIEIAPIESEKVVRIMEDFLGEVKVEMIRKRLRRALVGRKPYRAFKFVLDEYPELCQRWSDFQAKRNLAIARGWLADHDIEATGQSAEP